MAIPSGSGSEVLKSKLTQAISTTWTTIGDFSTSLNIYTCLSIIVTNCSSTDTEVMNLALTDDESSTNEHFLGVGIDIPAGGIFVWNNKLVVAGSGTYKYLRCNFNTAANMDVIVNYIDQDWT